MTKYEVFLFKIHSVHRRSMSHGSSVMDNLNSDNKLLYVMKIAIDGRGLLKWYVFHYYFHRPNQQFINTMYS